MLVYKRKNAILNRLEFGSRGPELLSGYLIHHFGVFTVTVERIEQQVEGYFVSHGQTTISFTFEMILLKDIDFVLVEQFCYNRSDLDQMEML